MLGWLALLAASHASVIGSHPHNRWKVAAIHGWAESQCQEQTSCDVSGQVSKVLGGWQVRRADADACACVCVEAALLR